MRFKFKLSLLKLDNFYKYYASEFERKVYESCDGDIIEFNSGVDITVYKACVFKKGWCERV